MYFIYVFNNVFNLYIIKVNWSEKKNYKTNPILIIMKTCRESSSFSRCFYYVIGLYSFNIRYYYGYQCSCNIKCIFSAYVLHIFNKSYLTWIHLNVQNQYFFFYLFLIYSLKNNNCKVWLIIKKLTDISIIMNIGNLEKMC